MRSRKILVLGSGVCALVAIVTSSLDRGAYFSYSFQKTADWEYPAALVATVSAAIVVETAITYAVFAVERAALWRPAALALLLLVPWGLWISEWVIHSPGFWMLHLAWVWLLISAMALTAAVSLVRQGYRAWRRRAVVAGGCPTGEPG